MKSNWNSQEFVRWYNENLTPQREQLEKYLHRLKLGSEDLLVDFGCGDGTLLDFAGRIAEQAVGIDSSPEQVSLARKNLSGRSNVRVIQGGFLDFDLPHNKYTRGSARKSLHHLTDPDKSIFFQRAGEYFLPGSLFIIEDAVFDFPLKDFQKRRQYLFDEAERFYGPGWEGMREAFTEMMEREFPTDIHTWESVLEAGGFSIIRKWHRTCFYGIILAQKAETQHER